MKELAIKDETHTLPILHLLPTGRCFGCAQHNNHTTLPAVLRVLILIPVMFRRLYFPIGQYVILSGAKDLWQRQPHLGRLFVSFVSICRYWGVAKLPITNSAVMGSLGSQGRLGRLGKAQSDNYTRYTYYPYYPYYTYPPTVRCFGCAQHDKSAPRPRHSPLHYTLSHALAGI